LGQTGVQTADVLGRNHPAASLVNRMANAAPFEPRFQIPMSALESDPNRNQQALARAFEENHSVATVVNQTTADSMSHPRLESSRSIFSNLSFFLSASNAETTSAVEQLKREFGAEHEPLIIAAMKKFGGNASDCKAFLNSRQLTTQFLIARFRLEDLDCQVDYDTLAQLTVTVRTFVFVVILVYKKIVRKFLGRKQLPKSCVIRRITQFRSKLEFEAKLTLISVRQHFSSGQRLHRV
jgi:hypothetical protein